MRTPGTEVPRRAEALRAALERHGATFVDASAQPDGDLVAVHDAGRVEYVADARPRWQAAGQPDAPGQDRAVPYVFAHPGLTVGMEPAAPFATWARPGYFAYETMTGTSAGTGAHRNGPLAPGCGGEAWVGAVQGLAGGVRDGGARALVAAFGVDAAGDDPEAPLAVTPAGFRAARRAPGALGVPTVLVEDGGYDLTTIGALGCETLAGVQEGPARA